MTFRAVLFDWRGTLVTTLSDAQWVQEALTRLGRDTARTSDVVTAIVAANGPEDRLDGPGVDSDAELHRRTYRQVLAEAGLDDELADALYAVESDLSLNRFADDVAGTLAVLHRHGVRVGVLSDLHVDVRPAFRAAGLLGLVDTFTLSFEQGVQKPDPRAFRAALDALGTAAEETLMVGDRAAVDGAAVELGMTVLLVPPLRSVAERRLHRVLALGGWQEGPPRPV
jgi:HAD superfamily hydrolase (TIGR01509 family)